MALSNHLRGATKKMPLQRYCRDCARAYDFNTRSASGRWIFCRCDRDERSQFGKFCKFASDKACEHFEEAQQKRL